MTLDLDLMKEQALELSRYYFKGFKARLTHIQTCASMYLNFTDKDPDADVKELVDESYGCLRQMQESYKSIPFEDLADRTEFRPLFTIDLLLPELKESMDDIFVRKNKRDTVDLETDITSIRSMGKTYSDSINSLLENIRAYEKDFTIGFTDYDNRTWNLKEV